MSLCYVTVLCRCTCMFTWGCGTHVFTIFSFFLLAHSPVGAPEMKRARRGRRRRRRGRRRSGRRRKRRTLLSTTDVVRRPGCRRTCQSPPPLIRYQPATTPKLTIARRHLHTVSFRAPKTAHVQETRKASCWKSFSDAWKTT